MSHVSSTTLPATSALHQRVRTGDFLDCYAVQSDLPPRKAAEIITAFPQWTKILIAIRGCLVAPFGLRATGPASDDQLGPFPVEHSGDREILAGFNDRHLDFRVSVLAQNGRIHLATWVHPHNLGGRAYLALILPFHILIARNALARVASASA